MTVFDGKRLEQDTLNLELEQLRQGYYSDQYFVNICRLLTQLARENYRYDGSSPRIEGLVDYQPGDGEVDMQIFMRRTGGTLIGGTDVALAILKHCSGYWDERGQFVNMAHQLEVEAVQDGIVIDYGGDPMHVQPVLKIRGPYRYFAHLETPILGYLTRISRVATNVCQTLVAAHGKPILFFPARFDLPDVQAADGYAYWLAVQYTKHRHKFQVPASVSTDAQGAWWGGKGGGTVPHALIATFLADTAEAMIQYARILPVDIPRIALVDFENDTVGTSLEVARRLFEAQRKAKEAGDERQAQCYRLDGVRLDTSGQVVDSSLTDIPANYGVNPLLVRTLRQALDTGWQAWNLPPEWQAEAERFCKNIKIAVTGGFNVEKITKFEAEGVPVDIYGVGSSLMRNGGDFTTDFSADIVRVKVNGEWKPMAKVGRQANTNPDLEPVTLA